MPVTQAEILPARTGRHTIRVTLEDGRRVFLNSSYDPGREAERWAETAGFEPTDAVVMFGLGAGHHAEALLRRLHPRNLLFAVEPIDAVWDCRENVAGLRELLSHPQFRRVRDWGEFWHAFTSVENHCWKNIRFLSLPAYQRLCPEKIRDFAGELRRGLNLLSSQRSTVFGSAALWQKNLLENLRHLGDSAPVSRVFEAFTGKPAIIVSAGPSLERELERLREARNRALIIATGTAARLLSRSGVHSDLVLSVDAGVVNYLTHFMGVWHTSSILVYDPTVHPQVVTQHTGPKAVMSVYPDCRWLCDYLGEDIGLVKTGGSISNIAFDLAVKMGADPIVLVGQDLAFSNGLTHAPGTFPGSYRIAAPASLPDKNRGAVDSAERTDAASAFTSPDLTLVPGGNGERLPTSRKLLAFLTWFEQEIANLKGRRRVINTSLDGALIRGADRMPLSQALADHCGTDLASPIDEIRRRLSSPTRFRGTRLLADLVRLRPRVAQLAEHAAEAASVGLALAEAPEGGTPEASSLRQRLFHLDRSLIRGIETVRRTLHFLITPPLVQLHALDLAAGDRTRTALDGRLGFYVSLERSMRAAEPLLEGAVTKLGGGKTGSPRLGAGESPSRGQNALDEDVGAAIRAAERVMQSEDWASAIAAWETVRRRFPRHAAGYLRGAAALRRAGNPSAAAALLARGRERVPHDPGIVMPAAQLAMQRHEWDAAAAAWAAVRNMLPGHAAGYSSGATALIRAGRLADAEALLAEGTGRFPDDPGVAVQRAQRGAIAVWRRIRERLPGHPAGYIRGAAALAEAGELDQSSALLAEGRKRLPRERGVAIQEAELAMRRRDWPVAAALWEAVRKMSVRQPDWAAAIGAWESVRERFPDHPAAYARGAAALLFGGWPDAAAAWIAEGLERFPDDLGLVCQSLELVMRRRDWPTAAVAAEALRDRFPGHPTGYARGAAALLQAGRTAEAETLLAEARGRFPEDPGVAIQEAELAMRVGDRPAVIAAWRAVRDLPFPFPYPLWRESVPLGEGTEAEAAEREMLALWEAVRDRFPDHPAGYGPGAGSLMRAGLTEEAEGLLAQARSRFEDDPGVAIQTAELTMHRRSEVEVGHPAGYSRGAAAWMRLRNLETAGALLAEGRERFPNDPGIPIQTAELEMLRQAWPAAIGAWKTVRERFPSHSAGYSRGSIALRRAGDLDAAAALLAEARTRFPEDSGFAAVEP